MNLLSFLTLIFGIGLVIVAWVQTKVDKAEAEKESKDLRRELEISRQLVLEQSNKLGDLFLSREKIRDERDAQTALSSRSGGTVLHETKTPVTQEEEAEIMSKFSKHADRLLTVQNKELEIMERETKSRQNARELGAAVRPSVTKAVDLMIDAINKVAGKRQIELGTATLGTVPELLAATFDEEKSGKINEVIVYSAPVGPNETIEIRVRPALMTSPDELMAGTSYPSQKFEAGVIRPPTVIIRYNPAVSIAPPNSGVLIAPDGRLLRPNEAELPPDNRPDNERIFSLVVDLIADARVAISTAKGGR